MGSRNAFAVFISLALLMSMSLCVEEGKGRTITVYYQLVAEEENILKREIFPRVAEEIGAEIRGINADNLDTIDKVNAEVRGGRGGSIGIVLTDIAYLGVWNGGDTYYDLTQLYENWSDKPEIFDPVLNAGIIDGTVVALPLRTDCEVLYYNEEAFEEYGAPLPDEWDSWDDLYNAAKTFKEKTGSAKLGLKGDLYEGLICNVLSYVWAAGGNVIDEQGNVVFNSPKTIEAFDFLKKLWNDGLIHQSSRIWREGSIVEEGMMTNQIYMALDWPYAMGMLQNAGKEEWKVALTPMGPETRATALGGWYFVVPKNAPDPELSWEFIKSMLSTETQLLINEKLGWSMANTETWEIDPSWPQWQKDLVVVQREMLDKYAKPRPQIDAWSEISMAIQNCFSGVVYGDKDAASAVNEAASQIEKVVSRA
ncbi:MAG: extracellular solute-binding protein [Candidatus Thermoplasmatota archaeon]|nr:extracellular solute-binding protein [Candidatus Thermoplasmatota archaeon]